MYPLLISRLVDLELLDLDIQEIGSIESKANTRVRGQRTGFGLNIDSLSGTIYFYSLITLHMLAKISKTKYILKMGKILIIFKSINIVILKSL